MNILLDTIEKLPEMAALRQAVLKEMKERAHLPILTKPAHARSLDGPGRRLFDLEARCTDLYDLCLEAVPTPGREWTTSPVRL